MRVVQTYWTNGGADVTCGFTFPDAFVKMANISVNSLLAAGHHVAMYTDADGEKFLRPRLIDAERIEWVVVDYSAYDFDKRFWNFPKLVTYSMQEMPFVHVDLDIVVGRDFCQLDIGDETIFTEMTREINPSDYKSVVGCREDYRRLICSGILGGTPRELFTTLLEKAKLVCKPREDMGEVRFETLVAVEEYEVTHLARRFNCKVVEADKSTFMHFCGANKFSRHGDFIWSKYDEILKTIKQ